jgi:hypothetical protein
MLIVHHNVRLEKKSAYIIAGNEGRTQKTFMEIDDDKRQDVKMDF